MGIDISQLGPAAQRQATQKIAEQERKKALAKRQADKPPDKKPNKYRNTPTERITGDGTVIKFDSKREAARYDELMLMFQAGQIRDLKLQPQFTLQEAYTTPEGKRVRAIRYDADFSYEKDGNAIGCSGWERVLPDGWMYVVEDVKSKATKTRVYAMKKKLLQERKGITITEVE